MARERLVTRTLKTTEGTGLFVDEEAKEVIERAFITGGYIDNEKKLIEKINATEEKVICVSIINKEFKEKVYSMPEDKFISIASERRKSK